MKIRTKLDDILDYIREKKQLPITDLRSKFDVSDNECHVYCRLLDESKIIKINYPAIGSPVVQYLGTKEEKLAKDNADEGFSPDKRKHPIVLSKETNPPQSVSSKDTLKETNLQPTKIPTKKSSSKKRFSFFGIKPLNLNSDKAKTNVTKTIKPKLPKDKPVLKKRFSFFGKKSPVIQKSQTNKDLISKKKAVKIPKPVLKKSKTKIIKNTGKKKGLFSFLFSKKNRVVKNGKKK